jgi:hypothetical protein
VAGRRGHAMRTRRALRGKRVSSGKPRVSGRHIKDYLQAEREAREKMCELAARPPVVADRASKGEAVLLSPAGPPARSATRGE